MMADPKDPTSHKHLSCTALYTKYDVERLVDVTGRERAAEMIKSSRDTHMIVV